MNSLASEWLVLNRPQLAGFHSPGDNLGSNKLKVTLSSANGSFKGSMANPATGKPLTFSGVVLKSQNVGRGFFLGPQNSGKVVIQ